MSLLGPIEGEIRSADVPLFSQVVTAGALEFVERMVALTGDPAGNAGAVRSGLVAWERVRRVVDAAMVAVVGEVERSALAGEVRRVVVDGAGVAIDLGGAARLSPDRHETPPCYPELIACGRGVTRPGPRTRSTI